MSAISSTEGIKQSTLGISGEKVKVTRVIDGDTIEIESGEKVQYIGIDTPETVDPKRPAGCFGKETSKENKKEVAGQLVFLVKDISETGRFGRLLRYVYLVKDGVDPVFINKYLLTEEFAKVDTIPPDVAHAEDFLEAQGQAQQEKRGLWARC